MSFRKWLNVFTFILIVLVLFFARNDLVIVWHLLSQVNLWILALILPVQLLSYYASGAMLFSFLKQKGDLGNVDRFEQPIMALELNFVNHLLPTAGMSGASYMTWRLKKLGISTGRATLAQVVRFAATFFSFATLLLLAVLLITIDGNINRVTILIASTLVGVLVVGTMLAMYALGSSSRLEKFSNWLDGFINNKIRRLIGSKKRYLVKPEFIHQTLREINEDYMQLRHNPKEMIGPFLWGLVFNLSETAMFVIAFLALGTFVNPAPVLIAIGLGGAVGALMATPGGAGGYELAMVFFLTGAGVNAGLATAGVVLARTILIIITIVTGYIFYHRALKKYGKDHA